MNIFLSPSFPWYLQMVGLVLVALGNNYDSFMMTPPEDMVVPTDLLSYNPYQDTS